MNKEQLYAKAVNYVTARHNKQPGDSWYEEDEAEKLAFIAGYSLKEEGAGTGEADFESELALMASWIDKIAIDNSAATRGAAKIKIGSSMKRLLESSTSKVVDIESLKQKFAAHLQVKELDTTDAYAVEWTVNELNKKV